MDLKQAERIIIKSDLRPKTKREYCKALSLLNFDFLDVERVNDFLFNSDYKTSTRYIVRSAIVKLYTLLRKKYLLGELEKVKWKSKQKDLYLTKNQIKELYSKCSDLKELLIVKLMAECGLRQGVVRCLRVSDLDLKERILTVQKNYEGNKKGEVYRVPFSTELVNLVEQYAVENNLESKSKLFEFKKYPNRPELDIYHIVNKIGLKCGWVSANSKYLSWLTPHILRHTFGTWFYQTTKDILQTRDALGQKSLAATERYAKSLEDLRKSQEKMLEELTK